VSRYVALGSSMAAGPGIRPSAAGAPFGSGRSARNYAHLVAERLNLDLVDVTFSGATTAHVLADRQRRAQPQIEALDGSEELVTITIGGNDVGYVPLLMAASLPAVARGGRPKFTTRTGITSPGICPRGWRNNGPTLKPMPGWERDKAPPDRPLPTSTPDCTIRKQQNWH